MTMLKAGANRLADTLVRAIHPLVRAAVLAVCRAYGYGEDKRDVSRHWTPSA